MAHPHSWVHAQGMCFVSSSPVVIYCLYYFKCNYSSQVGDIIKVTKQNENGMWEGELNGKHGHFPFKLVEVIDSNNHQ